MSLTASVPSVSFAVVPFRPELREHATRLFVSDANDRSRYIELDASATDEQIVAACGTLVTEGRRCQVLAEVPSTMAPNPVVYPLLPPKTIAPIYPVPAREIADDAQPAPSRDWSVQTIDAAAAARAKRDEETAALFGLALPPAFYALGTSLVQSGVNEAVRVRDAFERLPRADEAMRKLGDEVAAEKREDLVVRLADLRINKWAELTREPVDAQRPAFRLGIEADAMSRLQAELRGALSAPGDLGVQTLLSMKHKPDLVLQGARTWNMCAKALDELEMAAKTSSAEDSTPCETPSTSKTVQLRTRLASADSPRRQVFAVVSESYGEVDIHRVAQAIGQLSGIELLRADVVYDRRRARIDLITQTTVEPKDQAVGDMHRLAARIMTDDTGRGALKGYAMAERIGCRNRTLVSCTGAHMTIRHLGDTERLVVKLAEMLKQITGAAMHFAKQWETAVRPVDVSLVEAEERDQRKAFNEMVARFQSNADALAGEQLMQGIYRSLLRQAELVPVRRVEQVLPALKSAHWDTRNAMPGRDKVLGGLSRASVANGLTLWAQSLPADDFDLQHQTELLAGRVVSGEQALTWLASPPAKPAPRAKA